MLSFAIRRRIMSPSSSFLRTRAVAQHMMQSTSTAASSERTDPPVLFEENGSVRRYILNRPHKLNALDEVMINLMRPKLEQWENSDLCRMVIGTGRGRGFCAGGDVERVVSDGAKEETRPKAINYFKLEFELDFLLATLRKPYIAICDGITMGGGVGLLAHAPFRIATESTNFAMPETKIGYCPDVGANYFLSRLDGHIGTYLALTGTSLKGRAAFETGLATHFVPSARLPQLTAQLASLEEPTLAAINSTIEEHYGEKSLGEPSQGIVGEVREAVDLVFGHNSVDKIFASLSQLSESQSERTKNWAISTLSELDLRSPTSLRVALEAIRQGRHMTLAQVLQMEMNIATAFLSGASPDFHTGVSAVLSNKENRGVRPEWSPRALQDITIETVLASFFNKESPFIKDSPKLDLPVERTVSNSNNESNSRQFALPSETEIEQIVRGTHPKSGGVALSLDNLISKFAGMTEGKHGVEDKIREVAARRCVVEEDPDMHHCLRWKK